MDASSEAALFQRTEFRILDVTLGNTHLIKVLNLGGSLSDLLQDISRFQFKNVIQHHNSNAAFNMRSLQFYVAFFCRHLFPISALARISSTSSP
jgi:hypothetical protein